LVERLGMEQFPVLVTRGRHVFALNI